MNNRKLKMLDLAKNVATTSDIKQYKLGAVIVKGREVLSMAANSTKTHPLQKKFNRQRGDMAEEWTYLHAEIAAIIRVKNKKLLAGATIYIHRSFKCGSNAMARPCPACMAAISLAGIKKIVYTTDFGVAEETLFLNDK